MSNYTKATNFTAKDALPAGNSSKVVKGAELDTEFTAIAAAIASKSDSNSPTFTGTPLAPTASTGTNNTQIATTAFATAAAAAAFPSGGIIMWSGSVASIPSGWVLCNGSNGTPDLRNRFVVGAGSTYAVDATGGSLTTGNPSVADTGSTTLTTANLPAHDHFISNTQTPYSGSTLTNSNYVVRGGGSSGSFDAYTLSGSATAPTIGLTSQTGSGTGHTHTLDHTHTSTPPYYALAYIMKT